MTYSAGDHLVRVVMTAASGLPADAVVNDFAFKFDGSPITSDFDALFNAVDGFYNDTPATAVHKVGNFISQQISRSTTHKMDIYKIITGPLGSPVYTNDWVGPVASSSGSGLPEEVAAVLSFHADLTGLAEVGPVVTDIPSTEEAIDQGAPTTHSGSTRLKARRRGRIYLGPLNILAIADSTVPYLLSPDVRLALREQAVAMAAEALTAGWTWSVWSRRNVALHAVVGGWTDDTPDTQRRRGPKPTLRTTFTV